MLYVASFAIAQYKCTYRRMNKPFNPILGETFELVTPTFKYIGEQVSHHPPVSAAFATSKHYEFSMDTTTKMGFNGTYLKATPMGSSMIQLKTSGEQYKVTRPVTFVNNIIFGTMFVEHVGEMFIYNK